MGIKDDKHTNQSSEQAAYLVETLAPLGTVTSKKMFGSNGIFYEGSMFMMVTSKGDCYLKADEGLITELIKFGSEKHSKMPYVSLPEDIVNDKQQLIYWAKKSTALLK